MKMTRGEKESYFEKDIDLPTQGQSVVKGSDIGSGVQLQEKRRSPPDIIYLEVLSFLILIKFKKK